MSLNDFILSCPIISHGEVHVYWYVCVSICVCARVCSCQNNINNVSKDLKRSKIIIPAFLVCSSFFALPVIHIKSIINIQHYISITLYKYTFAFLVLVYILSILMTFLVPCSVVLYVIVPNVFDFMIRALYDIY